MHKKSIHKAVLAADFATIRRDPTLMLLLFVPLLILGILRFGFPVLANHLPAITEFFIPILAFFTLLNAVFPGFILSFMLLDEKDLELVPIIKATPPSYSGVLRVRLLSLIVLAFINSFLLMRLNGFLQISWVQSIFISLLCALNVPFIVLFISVVAKNKVEGLTLLKVMNIFLIIPIITLFIDTPWEYALGVLPPFWVYASFSALGQNSFYLFALAGLIITTLINRLFFSWSLPRM